MKQQLTPEAFISYARTDRASVQRLHHELVSRGRDVWIDWEDIHPSEAFMEAIERAIEAANVFVFIISPDSVRSQVCSRELDHAVARGKKLIPIVCCDVAAELVPPALARLNWLFAREADALPQAVEALVQALDTDLDWLKLHSRLLVRAVEWDRTRRERSFLLHGVDLDRAERALAHIPLERTPQPTPLQREYLLASRRRSSNRLRVLLGSVSVGLIVALGLAWIAEQQREAAESAKLRGLARQLAAQSELIRQPWGEALTTSLLLASESLRHYPSLEGDLAMRRALALLPRALVSTPALDDASALELSADGLLLAVAHDDGNVLLVDTLAGQQLAELTQPPAKSISWSRDSRYVLTTDAERTVRVWRVAGREIIAQFQLERGVAKVAFSADGARVAVTDEDTLDDEAPQSVILWNLATNAEVARFQPALPVQALALDSEGRRATILQSSFVQTKIEVRDEPFAAAVAERRLDGHAAFPIFDATASLLAFVNRVPHFGGGVSGEQTVVVVRLESDAESDVSFETTSLAHVCDVNGIELSPDAHDIVTTCGDGAVHAWSTEGGAPWASLAGPGSIARIAVGLDAELIALQEDDGLTHLFAPRTGRHVTSIRHAEARALAFTPDGRRLTILGADGGTGVWESLGGSEAYRVNLPVDAHSVHFSPDGAMIAACTEAGAFFIPLRRDAAPVPLAGSGNALGCAWSPDGTRFVTVSGSGFRSDGVSSETIGDDDIRIWDASAHLLERRARSIWSDFVLSRDGRYAAIADRGGSITIGETMSGRVVRELRIPEGAASSAPASPTTSPLAPRRIVSSLEFSPAGERLAVVYEERRVQVWDIATGTAGVMFELRTRGYASALSPDGRYVVTRNMENITSIEQLWDSMSGQEIGLGGPDRFFNEIAFSAEGQRIGTVEGERIVQVWDLPQRRERVALSHPEIVYAVAFSPDGKYVATGSADQMARIWEIATGRELARTSYDFRVFRAEFSPDGRYLVVPGGQIVWIESWRAEDLLAQAEERVTRNLTSEEWSQYLPEEAYRPTFSKLPDLRLDAASGVAD